MLFLLVFVQLALVFNAEQMVRECAFVAARAAVVGGDPEEAAALACVPITGLSVRGMSPFPWPGLSGLTLEERKRYTVGYGLGQARKTRVMSSSSDKETMVEVEHRYELIIPLANRLLTAGGGFIELYGVPHLSLRAKVLLSNE